MRVIEFCLAPSVLAQYPGLFSLCLPLGIASGFKERVSGGGRRNKPSSDTGCCVTLDQLLTSTHHSVFTC